MSSALSTPAQKTAFVLAGGGSFGAIQVGMMRALLSHGVTADLVVGSSIGAINGAYFAGDPTCEGMEKLAGLWRSIRRREIFPVTWRTVLSLTRRRDFLVEHHGLRRLISRNLPYENLQDAKIPIHVVTTDVLSGGSIVLSSGSAADAILASMAFPGAFPAVRVHDVFLCDGSITSNTPVRSAVARGATRLVVIPTGYACALKQPPSGILANAFHAVTLLIARQLVAELEGLSDNIDYVIVPTLCPLSGSPYDFSQTDYFIDRATENTLRWIAEGGLEKREIPQELKPHRHHPTVARVWDV